jgi:hypothetical protein
MYGCYDIFFLNTEEVIVVRILKQVTIMVLQDGP